MDLKLKKKFVSRLFDDPIPLEEVDWKNSYHEDDVIYYKPHCVIHTADKNNQEIYFETVEELDKYVDELKAQAPHIIV